MSESLGSLKLTNGSSPSHGKMNGQPAARQQPTRRRKGFAAYCFDAIARLTIWAIILTIVFRCPSSLHECDETSPALCEQYFRAKSLAAPYVQPLYDHHVLPYVDVVKPYYAVVDNHVFSPARAYAAEYGGPLVDKAREEVSHQWSTHAQPTVDRLRDQIQEDYDRHVSPYLTKLSELSQPVLRIALKALQQLYYELLLPLLDFTKPYAFQGYRAAHDFTTAKAAPAVQWAWSKATAFLDRAVWPQLRMVYVENIEPQLVRIGERLERYKNKTGAGFKSKSQPEPLLQTTSHTGASKKPLEPPQSSFVRPAPQSTFLPGSDAAAAAADDDDADPSPVRSASIKSDRTINAPWKPVRAPVPSENETEQRRKAREMVSSDLDMWQHKFAAQADEGAMAMEEHIDEIAQRMMFEGVVVKGQGLLRELESTTESELELLRSKILSIVVDASRETGDANADADAKPDADAILDASASASASAEFEVEPGAPANADAPVDAEGDVEVDAGSDSKSHAHAAVEEEKEEQEDKERDKGKMEEKEEEEREEEKEKDGRNEEDWRQVVSAVRSAGLAIKHAARAVRDWRETYEEELQALVLEAATVHFQILDETRGLALQQIGMKWAWTDGVTYKDWAKYHDLKKTLSEWTEELKKLIVTNPTLLQAQEASAQVEDDGMVIASAAAQELARLKEVAHFKMLAKDSSDNFDLEAMKMAVENPHKVAEPPQLREEKEEEEEKAQEGKEEDQNAATASRRGGSGDEQMEDSSESHSFERQTLLPTSSEISEEATISPPSETDTIGSDDQMTEHESASIAMSPTGFILAQGFIFNGHEEPVLDELNDTPEEMERPAAEAFLDTDPGLAMRDIMAENATGEETIEASPTLEGVNPKNELSEHDEEVVSGEGREEISFTTDVPEEDSAPKHPPFVNHG